jgi:hypothetical protein
MLRRLFCVGALKMFTGMLGVGDQCDTPKMRIDVSEQL